MSDIPAAPGPALGTSAGVNAEGGAVQPSVPDTTKAAEKAALNIQKKLSSQALPVRQYLESTVVPLLMQGLQSLCKERPDNPVEYLANYLLQHNPQKAAPTAAAAGPAGGSAPTAAAAPAAGGTGAGGS